MRHSRQASWVFACCALLALGCSVLVDPENATPRCALEKGKDDPCPTGHACISGRCEPIDCQKVEICSNDRDDDCDGKTDERNAMSSEICGDRKDNDCDGKIDEQPSSNLPEICGNGTDDDCDGKLDEGHDQDMDGTPWCGNAKAPNGGGQADCDDYDPSVHPGAMEICDGRDNDCDGRVDETTTQPLCPQGQACAGQRCQTAQCDPSAADPGCGADQRCDPDTSRCVPIGCTADSCTPPLFCDLASGECRSVRRTNGEPCAADSDCASDSCIDVDALRIASQANGLCGQACCSDADCPDDQRCYVSGSGARTCLPVKLVPRDPHGLTQCIADDSCNDQQTCALVSGQTLIAPASPLRDDLVAPACETPNFGALEMGRACGSDSACASGACVPGTGVLPISLCSHPCGNSGDCRELADAATILAANPRSYCRFVQRLPSGDYVPVCVLDRGETGTRSFGEACRNGSDCAEGACVGAAGDKPGTCSVACCRNSDCPRLSTGPTLCRPVAFGEHFEMRCMP